MSIGVRQLTKKFDGVTAVDQVTFEIGSGALAALLGPSGSGKSTLLRMIAGLEVPDSGDILITGQEAFARSARDRNVGFVFQHYALFRHMTVRDNIAFGLSVRGMPKPQQRARVEELLRLVSLEGLGHRFPSQLSGGQRQRVALARTLAPEPKVLLLDEPFGALDAKVREELREWIVRLHEETHVTTLFVTHDQSEALDIAHRVFVMNRGRLEQAGTPQDIFERPDTEFVARFVGDSNFIDGRVDDQGGVSWGSLWFPVRETPPGTPLRIYFRPHDVYLSHDADTFRSPGVVTGLRFRGAFTEIVLDVGQGKNVVAHVPKGVASAGGFAVGRGVYLGVTPFHAFLKEGPALRDGAARTSVSTQAIPMVGDGVVI